MADLGDKARNTKQEVKGKAKEAAGRLTGDARLEKKGRDDQAKGSVKQAGEKIKDALRK